jgi:hypothetical protein
MKVLIHHLNTIPREFVLACLQKAASRRPQNAEAAEVWWPRHLPGLAGPPTATTGKRQTTAVVM